MRYPPPCWRYPALTPIPPAISKPSTLLRGISRLANPHDDPNGDRLKALSDKIEARKATQPDDSPHQKKDYALANLAWRMVIELVAGLGIGFGIGYGLDWLFGTIPIFLVIFTLLGLAAGIKTMLGSAQELGEKQAAKYAAEQEDNARGD
ncbi:MAG TPA: F0F1 ATP synthase subunit I [Maritimibacter sp.]|nr:F0F1 ATP synthase subunit I [Maritimibacter sp.]